MISDFIYVSAGTCTVSRVSAASGSNGGFSNLGRLATAAVHVSPPAQLRHQVLRLRGKVRLPESRPRVRFLRLFLPQWSQLWPEGLASSRAAATKDMREMRQVPQGRSAPANRLVTADFCQSIQMHFLEY